MSIPFILGDKLCTDLFPAEEKANVIAQLLSISMFMCGLATIIQTTFGVRYVRHATIIQTTFGVRYVRLGTIIQTTFGVRYVKYATIIQITFDVRYVRHATIIDYIWCKVCET